MRPREKAFLMRAWTSASYSLRLRGNRVDTSQNRLFTDRNSTVTATLPTSAWPRPNPVMLSIIGASRHVLPVGFWGVRPPSIGPVRLWRRGWDSNPRYRVNGTLAFQASPFDRSGTSP